MTTNESQPPGQVTVFGAYGHTGRFVVTELLKRGIVPVLAGRNADKLRSLAQNHPDLEARVASVEDPASLKLALGGVSGVINCAGPFIDTAHPIIEAALAAGIHYFDVAAEQAAVRSIFANYVGAAQRAGVVVAPALAFYGGLSDLLATAAAGDWAECDEIDIAVALDSWKPTLGTRRTGERNPGPRVYFIDGELREIEPPPPRDWRFAEPFGEAEVVSLSLAEAITIPHHLRTRRIRAYINRAPLSDLMKDDTPSPVAADESGKSAQIFLVEVVVRRQNEERCSRARGRDIYAVSAPIVAEAVARVLDGRVRQRGLLAPGEFGKAHEFLTALAPEHLEFQCS